MCLGAIASCAATACAGCCCTAFKDCSKKKYGPGSRIPYMFIMFIFSVFAICMVLFGGKELFKNDLLDIDAKICNQDSCRGNGSVYRTSFTLFLFFAIHAFIVFFVLSFHHLFFIIKLFCLIAVLTITFFIPGPFFEDGYVNFARVGSGIFLLIQIYVLIGWAYDTNDKINDKIIAYDQEQDDPDKDLDEQGNKTLLCLFKALIIGGTLIFYSLCIVFWVFQFEWFVYYGDNTYNKNCSFNQAMLAILIVLVLLLSVLTVIIQTGGSIFTTSIVSFYMSYLTYSALESMPDEECNWFANANNQSSISLWLGCIITAAAISYTGFSVSRNQVNMTDGSSSLELSDMSNKKKNKNNIDDDDDEDLGSSNYDDATDTKIGGDDGMDTKSEAYASERKANVTFHICMAFASIYMCMLYTGWGDDTLSDNGKARGWTSVTVNLVCVLITVLLYGWTLIAPRVCPSRFGVGDDDEDDGNINMEI